MPPSCSTRLFLASCMTNTDNFLNKLVEKDLRKVANRTLNPFNVWFWSLEILSQNSKKQTLSPNHWFYFFLSQK